MKLTIEVEFTITDGILADLPVIGQISGIQDDLKRMMPKYVRAELGVQGADVKEEDVKVFLSATPEEYKLWK